MWWFANHMIRNHCAIGRLDISEFLKGNFPILKKNPAASLNCAITEDVPRESADVTPDIALLSSMLGGTYLAP
jgi:hypothetical protein